MVNTFYKLNQNTKQIRKGLFLMTQALQLGHGIPLYNNSINHSLQKIETKPMPQNYIKKNTKYQRKPSASLSDSSDFSSDSQQTTFEESQEIKRQYALHDAKYQEESSETYEQDEKDMRRPLKQQKQQFMLKKQFSSISRVYNEEVQQRVAMNRNWQIKREEENRKIRQWKVSLYRKVYFRHQKGKTKLQGKHYLSDLYKLQVIRQKESKQFTLYVCNCLKRFLKKSALKQHLKNGRQTHHYQRFSMNSLENREKLSKYYNKFGHLFCVQSFDPQLLYQNFQVVFIDAEINYRQFNNFPNEQFTLSLIDLKDFDIVFTDSYDQEVQKWFKNQWLKIYKDLHEIHKSNQFICHKCFSIQEHISLFALAMHNFIEKRKRYQFSEMDQINFKSISKLIQVVLKDCIEKSKHKKIKIKSTDFKKVSKFLECLRNLLFRYFDTFEYIDLNEFQVKKELNHDLC